MKLLTLIATVAFAFVANASEPATPPSEPSTPPPAEAPVKHKKGGHKKDKHKKAPEAATK